MCNDRKHHPLWWEKEKERGRVRKAKGNLVCELGRYVYMCMCVWEITMLIVTTACPLQLSPLSPSRVQRLLFVFLLRCARFMACYIILLPRHACHMLPSASVCAASASPSCCCLSCNQLPVSRDSNRFNHWKRNWNRTCDSDCDCDWGCCCCSWCQKKATAQLFCRSFCCLLFLFAAVAVILALFFSTWQLLHATSLCTWPESRVVSTKERGGTRDMWEESALHCGPYPEYACSLRTALTMGGFCWDFKLVFCLT